MFYKAGQEYHTLTARVLENLFSAFTGQDASPGTREKCLEVYHECLRTVSWADGLEEEVLTESLDDSFNTWMGLFVQLLQSNPKIHFGVKRSALRCLNVIFRDIANYSRESVVMILEPAWKLLNVNLAIYTEAECYGAPIEFTEDEKT